MPEAKQFTVHAAEAPAGILRTKPRDELPEFLGEGWASWGRGLSPFPLDETLVPGQQGCGQSRSGGSAVRGGNRARAARSARWDQPGWGVVI
jgi:hypothetical protein